MEKIAIASDHPLLLGKIKHGEKQKFKLSFFSRDIQEIQENWKGGRKFQYFGKNNNNFQLEPLNFQWNNSQSLNPAFLGKWKIDLKKSIESDFARINSKIRRRIEKQLSRDCYINNKKFNILFIYFYTKNKINLNYYKNFWYFNLLNILMKIKEEEKIFAVCKKVAEKYDITWKNSFIQWYLPENIVADFSLTLALPISHKTKQNPQKIAAEIIENIANSNFQATITEQGYINFCFPTTYYQNFLWETFQQEGKNLPREKKNTVVNFEFVSANPTGYLHLAHFRHAIIGNTLADVYQFLGYKVVREYYINDRGGQIVSLVDSIYYLYQLRVKKDDSEFFTDTKKEYILSKSSQEIAQKLEEKWHDEYLGKKLAGEIFAIWKKEILALILTKIRQDLATCGIKFDIWFSETSLYEKNKHLELISELEKKNLVYSQEKAVLFRSSLNGDEKDRVIIKQDGEYTYFFSDILYHLDKLKRADRVINIWGADHHGYIERIKSVGQLLGYQPETIQIILVQMVSLLTEEGQNKRFSKRLGNAIELEEILTYLDLDQLKFFLLEKDPNQSLAINTKLLKENKEKTRLYYIQYAHARCQQIFNKAEEKGIKKISSNINLLKEKEERKIFNFLIRFPFVLVSVAEENKPHHLINYLYELARVWQVYYQKYPILELENQELTAQKLLLVKNIQIILQQGLKLMGVEAPQRM